MTVTFATTVVLIGVMYGAVIYISRNQVRETVRQQLDASQRMVAALQYREQRLLRLQAENVAESPTLKAAIDTYAAEAETADASVREQLHNTIVGELRKIASRVEADAIVVIDTHRRTLGAAGRMGSLWPTDAILPPMGDPSELEPNDGVMRTSAGIFRVISAPLVLSDGSLIGTLYLATSLDDAFAERLSGFSNTGTAILSDSGLIAGTLSPAAGRVLGTAIHGNHDAEGTVDLDGEAHAFRRLLEYGDIRVYALTSIDGSARSALWRTTRALSAIALGALVLALAGSIALSRLLSGPVGRLSAAIQEIARSRAFTTTLPPDGSSLELDALTGTFRALMDSVVAAEAETKAACTAAIRGLAAALDARDPYTAGHSERVSTLSVTIGRAMGLPENDLEVLRLGALLHDIGKIAVPDEILRKPGRLSSAEYDIIKRHPVVGARIIGTVPFLAPHVPIVALHHERPDGKGYPNGLRGLDIPAAVRIVHVADAFDAMTSARAYRSERTAEEAMRELWAGAGTEFHADVVSALSYTLTGLSHPVEASYGDQTPLLEARSA